MVSLLGAPTALAAGRHHLVMKVRGTYNVDRKQTIESDPSDPPICQGKQVSSYEADYHSTVPGLYKLGRKPNRLVPISPSGEEVPVVLGDQTADWRWTQTGPGTCFNGEIDKAHCSASDDASSDLKFGYGEVAHTNGEDLTLPNEHAIQLAAQEVRGNDCWQKAIAGHELNWTDLPDLGFMPALWDIPDVDDLADVLRGERKRLVVKGSRSFTDKKKDSTGTAHGTQDAELHWALIFKRSGRG